MHTTRGDGSTAVPFPEVFLINLDRSTDRLAKFMERNAHLDRISRFSAVDGALADRSALAKNGTISEDHTYLPGALGCALSHVQLWKRSVTHKKILTVFEDDVISSFNFQDEARQVLRGLPADWDIVLWGYNFNPLFMWLDFGFSKAKLQFYDFQVLENINYFRQNNISTSAVRLAHAFGSMSYSVSPNGARTLLDYCLPLRKRLIPFPGTGVVIDDIGIDCAMCGAYPAMQAFACIPPLVIHDDTVPSDRTGSDKS